MDVELLDLHDCCYVRQAIVDNAINRRSRELLRIIKKLRVKFNVMKDRERVREEEYEELQAICESAMIEFEKNPTLVALREKISTLSSEVKEHKAYEQGAKIKEPFYLSKVKGYHSFYKKDHTQASNDLATATFAWLDEFVADPLALLKRYYGRSLYPFKDMLH
nr:hypothetical protein [Tanacetum cinerariifolium]